LRGLLAFWALLLLVLGAGAGVLQYLGAPVVRRVAVVSVVVPVVAAPSGPAAPDAALAEARAGDPTAFLPKIASDGRRAMSYYAAPAKIPAGAKIVALLIDGMGLSQSVSVTAIQQLPAAVSFAFSPYSADPGRWSMRRAARDMNI